MIVHFEFYSKTSVNLCQMKLHYVKKVNELERILRNTLHGKTTRMPFSVAGERHINIKY